jgi:hypothetical protein
VRHKELQAPCVRYGTPIPRKYQEMEHGTLKVFIEYAFSSKFRNGGAGAF